MVGTKGDHQNGTENATHENPPYLLKSADSNFEESVVKLMLDTLPYLIKCECVVAVGVESAPWIAHPSVAMDRDEA